MKLSILFINKILIKKEKRNKKYEKAKQKNKKFNTFMRN